MRYLSATARNQPAIGTGGASYENLGRPRNEALSAFGLSRACAAGSPCQPLQVRGHLITIPDTVGDHDPVSIGEGGTGSQLELLEERP